MNVDWERIQSFASEDDPEDMEWLLGMLQTLIENTEERLSELDSYTKGNEVEKVRAHLHQLKGVAANFGLTNFHKTCLEAETMIKEEQVTQALTECSKLPGIWQDTRKELEDKYFKN
ncbi:MAG: Hpt domain-containing protein [Spirochaetota bacterium]